MVDALCSTLGAKMALSCLILDKNLKLVASKLSLFTNDPFSKLSGPEPL